MKKSILLSLIFVFTICMFNAQTQTLWADEQLNIEDVPGGEEQEYQDFEDEFHDEEFSGHGNNDPLENYNRPVFKFNDNVYNYGIKPFNKGYELVPEPARASVRKFFTNIFMPGRFLNCLFQGKMKGAGTEMARFIINSSMGIGGLFDPAKKFFNLELQDEDFGQTLARYGVKDGAYIVMPFIGPSNVRDTIGFIGDIAMNPLTFVSIFVTPFASIGNPYATVNDFSLDEGQLYESVVDAAIDPYVAIQDAYIQNRKKKIEE